MSSKDYAGFWPSIVSSASLWAPSKQLSVYLDAVNKIELVILCANHTTTLPEQR